MRAPQTPLAWLAASTVFLLCSVGLEGLWRSRGLEPLPTDGPDKWVESYVGAMGTEGAAIVLGSSRSALGVDPTVLAESLGVPTYLLAINGANPIPLLEHLANDTDFRGVVFVEFMERRFFTAEPEDFETTRRFIAAASDPSLVRRQEASLRELFSRHLVVTGNAVTTVAVVRSLASERELPRPPPRHMRDDRFIETDVSQIDGDALDRRWARVVEEAVLLDVPAQQEQLEAIAGWRRTLTARGATVLFFRPPSTGVTGSVEDRRFPRGQYYDRAKRIIGGHWVHGEDDHQLRCFDGSHLDPRDVPLFTARLAAAIDDRT